MTDTIRIILGTVVVVAIWIIVFIIRRAWRQAQGIPMTFTRFCDQLRKEQEEEEDKKTPEILKAAK